MINRLRCSRQFRPAHCPSRLSEAIEHCELALSISIALSGLIRQPVGRLDVFIASAVGEEVFSATQHLGAPIRPAVRPASRQIIVAPIGANGQTVSLG